VDLHHVPAHAEILELLLEDARVHDQAVAIVGTRAARRFLEHRDFGQAIGTVRSVLAEREALLPLSARGALLGVIHDLRRTLARGSHGRRGLDRRGSCLARLFGEQGLWIALRGHALAPSAPLAPHREPAPPFFESAVERRERTPRGVRGGDGEVGHAAGSADRERDESRDRASRAADCALERDMGHRERAKSRRECIREQRTPGPERPRLVAREPGAHRAARGLAEARERCAEQGRKRARGQEQQRDREAKSRGRRRESPAGQKPRADHGHDRDQQIGSETDALEQTRRDQRADAAAAVDDAARAPQRIRGRVAPQRERCEDGDAEQTEARRLAHECAGRSSEVGAARSRPSPLRPSHGRRCPSNSPPGIR
jgi:hypothetical protein